MDRRMARDLDNYITGHYGEDQFLEDEEDQELCDDAALVHELDQQEEDYMGLGRTSAFKDFVKGDVVRVIYHETPSALMVVTKVNVFSIEGIDGETKCKVTSAGISKELRFYADVAPNRQTVLRHVKLVKEQK